MADAGLVLLGFMDESLAIEFLRKACVVAGPTDDAALRATWTAAKSTLGTPLPNAGKPDIQQIPPGHDMYLRGVMNSPRWQLSMNGVSAPEFKMVEISPLLAFQFHVDLARAGRLMRSGAVMTDITAMLEICLPQKLLPVEFEKGDEMNGFWIRSRDPNLQVIGRFQAQADPPDHYIDFGGPMWGQNSPLVQVAHHGGRYFLKNGYHRAYGLAKAGATHMPCLVVDAPSYEAVGIRPPGGTFQAPLLESANPPSIAHFVRGSAASVTLRSLTKLIHVSWAEQVFADL